MLSQARAHGARAEVLDRKYDERMRGALYDRVMSPLQTKPAVDTGYGDLVAAARALRRSDAKPQPALQRASVANEEPSQRLGSGRPSETRPRPKLEIGAVDDPLEHEANRIAERVMRTPDPGVAVRPTITMLSRKCAACEDEDEHKVQTKPATSAAAASAEAPASVHDVLRSSGRPLDPSARAFFEPRFGRGLGEVRIHDDAAAAASAHTVGALAYTVGRDVVFGHGRYAPETPTGRSLLAHELVHVVQQGGGEPPGSRVQMLQRTTHAAPTTPTNCHNWTIPLPPWIAGALAHTQISATLGILPHAIPRATKLGGALVGVPSPPAITPLGFADLWKRDAGGVNVAEIKSTATGGTTAAREASHYRLRHMEWLGRETSGTADATDAAYLAAVGGFLPGGLLDLSSVTGTDLPLGMFVGDPGKVLHIEADSAGAVVYWCTGAGIIGSPLWVPILKRMLDELKKMLDDAKRALQAAAEALADAIAAAARLVARILVPLLVALLILAMVALLAIAIICLIGAAATFGVTALCTVASIAAMGEAAAAILLLIGLPTNDLPTAMVNTSLALNPQATQGQAENGADYDRDPAPAPAGGGAGAGAVAALDPVSELSRAFGPLRGLLSDPVAGFRSISAGLESVPSNGLPTLNRAVAVLSQNGDAGTASFIRTIVQNSGMANPGALAQAEAAPAEAAPAGAAPAGAAPAGAAPAGAAYV